MIGTGDESTKDPVTGGERNVALPLFVRQNSGPALRGGGDCSGSSADLGLRGGRGRKCVSRRRFRIHLRHPKGDRLKRAKVYVNGKRVKVIRRRGKRLRATVDLRGLPKGRITVKIQAVTRKGRHLREVRRYRTCGPRRR